MSSFDAAHAPSRKPVCVCTADWHLQRHAWARHPTLRDDAYHGLERVVDFCTSNGLPLIAAGDLFDQTHPDSYSVWFACAQMERMRSAGLDVWFVQGQHEYAGDKPWLGLHPWPVYVNKKAFLVGPFVAYGLDYHRPGDAAAALAGVPPYAKLLIAHQVWADLMGGRNADCSVADVPHVDLIVSGDFHDHRHFLATGKSGQTVKFVSPGPLCLQALNEKPDKHFYVLHDDGSLDSVRLPTRAVYSFVVRSSSDLDDATAVVSGGPGPPADGLGEALRKPILHVDYSDDVAGTHDVVTEAAGDRYHVFLTPRRQRKDDRQPVAPPGRDGLEAVFAENLPPGSPILAAAMRLLRSDDPEAELAAMYAEEFNTPGAP